jgi:hypothetical protein
MGSRLRLGIGIARSRIGIESNIEDEHLDQERGSKKEISILNPDPYS